MALVLTLTVLALAAALGLGYWFRRSFRRSRERKRRDAARKDAAALRLKQDRLDCLELERSLAAGKSHSSAPVGLDTAPAPRP
jgi:hypothetical protein